MKDRIQHQVSWDFVDENKKKKKQEQFLSSVWNVLNFNYSTAKVMPRFTLGQREWLLSFFANFFFFVPTSNVVVDTLSSPTALGLRFITNFNHFLRIEYFLHDKVKRRRSFCSFLPEDFLEKKKGQKKKCSSTRNEYLYIHKLFSRANLRENTNPVTERDSNAREKKTGPTRTFSEAASPYSKKKEKNELESGRKSRNAKKRRS